MVMMVPATCLCSCESRTKFYLLFGAANWPVGDRCERECDLELEYAGDPFL